MEFADQPVPDSPFYVNAYDVRNVRVDNVEDGIVGKQSSFTGNLLYTFSDRESYMCVLYNQCGKGYHTRFDARGS